MSSTTTATLAVDVADDVGDFGNVGLRAALEDDGERAIQTLGEELGAVHAARVGRDDDDLVVAEPFLLEVVAEHRHRHQVVDRDVEEALNLRGVQVHRDDAPRAGDLEHVRDDLGRDRLAAFGLLVLLGVPVIWNDRRDARGRRAAQRVDHQQQLHHRVVDAVAVGRFADRLDDEDLGAAHVLADLDARLFVLELRNERFADVQPRRLAISSASCGLEFPLEEQRVLAHAPRYASLAESFGPRRRLRGRQWLRSSHSSRPLRWPAISPRPREALADGVRRGDRAQTLLGVTGSGKTMAMARDDRARAEADARALPQQDARRPALRRVPRVLSEERGRVLRLVLRLLSARGVRALTDTYIEKDSSINDEIERLRHSATQSLLTRRDTLIVASVSCIYGLGSPSDYMEMSVRVRVGDEIDRDVLLRKLVDMQYRRNDINLVRGTFRVRGDTLEFVGVDEELVHRIEFFGDEIEAINVVNMLTGEYVESKDELLIFPAKHFITPEEKLRRAIDSIEVELEERLAYFKRHGKLLEAQRLEMRTRYDLDMLREVGYCNGIENYSRHLTGREPGSTPWCLLDFFPKDWLLFVDESHVTLPQVHGMYAGDRSRKEVAGRARLPAAERARQPAAHVRRVRRAHQSGRLRFGDAGHVRDRAQHAGGRDDHPPDRPRRSRSRGAADAQSGRRSHGRDRAARRAQGARAGDDADEEDGRRSHRFLAREWACGCATCTARSTRSNASRFCAICAPACSTCSSASICCAKVSICRRSRSSAFSMPTRKAICAAARR